MGVNWLKVFYKLPRTLVRDYYMLRRHPGSFDIRGEKRLKNFARYKRTIRPLYRKPKMHGRGPYANVKWPVDEFMKKNYNKDIITPVPIKEVKKRFRRSYFGMKPFKNSFKTYLNFHN